MDLIDNTDDPWRPRLYDKPWALVAEDSHEHPYSYELENLEFSSGVLEPPNETSFRALSSTELEFVNTPEGFTQTLSELKECDELAVDLEHHSQRSYLGLTCLMQLSTRKKDYIIDTIALRRQMPKLLEIFANPNIIKVMHGADMDILWLQRDFSIYVVNMFDTGQAARELKYPSYSLAFLLKTFCDVDSDKRYQLADWRIRPLTTEMMKYARNDTHYLLFIYDKLRQELAYKAVESHLDPHDVVKTVILNSRNICLKIYSKPNYQELERDFSLFSERQKHVLKAILKWRDDTARHDDENPGWILSKDYITKLGTYMPGTVSDVVRLCPQGYGKSHASDIAYAIASAVQEISEIPLPAKGKNNERTLFAMAGWTADAFESGTDVRVSAIS